jgi:MoaA/NifB/PqqE/SkfB family radical SAM enzyme
MTDKNCIYAWRGCHIQPSGRVTPCCLVTQMGNSTVNDIDASRNNDEWIKLRKDLMAGIENPACSACWSNEAIGKTSRRQMGNNSYKHLWPHIQLTETGELTDSHISLWDVRETNLCNMKCIMCDSGYSSLINHEAIRYHGKLDGYDIAPKGNTSVVHAAADHVIRSYVIPKLDDHLANIYFAGGEPLISKLHWDILEHLIETNNTDIILTYNTNMLKLTHFGKNIIDMWKHFKKVYVGASIDAVGARAEYARAETVWKTVDNNFKDLANSGLDNLVLALNSTQSWYTIGGLVDLLDWVDQYDNIYHVMLSTAKFSPKFEVNLLPKDTRESIINVVDNRIMNDVRYESWRFLKQHMLQDTFSTSELAKHRNSAIRFTNALDQIRGNNLLTVCPELKNIIRSWA